MENIYGLENLLLEGTEVVRVLLYYYFCGSVQEPLMKRCRVEGSTQEGTLYC